MTMSSKFSRRRQIQTTPVICKKGPPPTDIFESPFNETTLQASATWNEPIPYADLRFTTPIVLPPVSPYFQWYGISPQSEHQLALYLELIAAGTEWNLYIDRWRNGYLIQTYQQLNIAMRSTNPIQTELIQFGIPTQYFDVHAWVAF